MKLPIYTQRDLRWCNDKIGQSNKTLGKWGCAATSLCNGSNAVTGTDITPQILAHNVALFTKEGDIIWDKACAFMRKIKFLGREDRENQSRIVEALRDPQQFAILQVNRGTHFVLAWSKPIIGKDLVCLDSWDGKLCKVKERYHDITGARYFSAK